MKVFVAGATGVLGWRAVRDLVKAGHDVTAVARTPAKAEVLRSLGATPLAVDLFDAAAVKDAVAGHDVVCNLATHIPTTWKMAMRNAWKENDRIRTEVSRNLVDAGLAGGASRYIQESIAFMYPDRGAEWIDEDTPVQTVPYVASALDAEANAKRFTESGGVGVVLRFGNFYGPGSEQTAIYVRAARSHVAPTMGSRDGYFPMIHLDDAADAVVTALAAPAGTYNIVDDALTRDEQMDALAAAVNVGHLAMAPAAATKVGGKAVSMLSRSQRVSNTTFKEATGWSPAYPSVRQGWPAVVREMGGSPPTVGLLARLGLLILGFTALELGVWAVIAPQSFYKSFPGAGRHWIDLNGPFNEHFIRDFGGLNLALALVTIAALVVGTRGLVSLAAGAWLAWSIPHVLYHFLNFGVFTDTADKIANGVTLSATILIPALVLWAAWRPQSTSAASSSRKSLASP
jgi:nucleoside-diphosphate-sugar epimerase